MSTTRRTLTLLLLAALTAGCRSSTEPGDVQVRVRNASTFGFESVVVHFPGSREEYGAVAAGETSDYRKVQTAYRIATVEVLVEGALLRLQVIDYVGEQTLPPGRYTYRLLVDVEGNLGLELVGG